LPSFPKCVSHFCNNYSEVPRDVLLVFPGKFKASDPQIPLALLHVAASIKKVGLDVRIFDMRVEDYHSVEVGNPLFVGLSCMSGLQIKYALEFARYVRAQNNFCPLVWGGVHPTLLPEQTARNNFVDIVVRGEGELVVQDLAVALVLNRPLDTVAGITYSHNGSIRSTPDGKVVDLDSLPIALPYELLQMEKYPSFKSGRFHIQTSRGCPHRCGFCYNSKFNKNHWRGKSAKRVLDEIEYIKKTYPHIKIIDPIDDNVFVDEYRVREICQGLIHKKLGIQWRANCRFDYLANYDKSFLELLEKAGCVELDFGGESGSDRLQQLICKDVTTDEMVQSVDNLRRWAPSIEPYVSWMSGLPGETDEDLAETFDLMDRLREVNPKTQHFGIFVYTPFPSPVMQYLPSEYILPQSLEQWGNVDVFQFSPPWHSKKRIEKLHTISAVARCTFYPQSRIKERSLTFKFSYRMINKVARYRWQHRYFGFPIELRIVDALAKRLKGFL
jgi:anaerobic magnesium-protoporphyrin IX monomethyl ester cyclase